MLNERLRAEFIAEVEWRKRTVRPVRASASLPLPKALARTPTDGRRLSPTEIVEYLRSLPKLWADSDTAGRHAIVAAILARIDVLGFERMEYDSA